MKSITIIFTCYNRKEKTLKCLETIEDDNLKLSYIAVDDKSTDGTAEAVRAFLEGKNREYELLDGTGSLYWAGGMRKGIGYYLERNNDTDYVCLVNDDVDFYNGALKYMVERSEDHNGAVIVGVTTDSCGKMTYGGVKSHRHSVKYDLIPIEKADEMQCDTFNCNCVLLRNDTIRKAGNFDDAYTHALADYDYGFSLKRLGEDVFETDRAIGVCEWPSVTNSWKDATLSRKERLQKKESPKGLPRREWFHYLKKNHGIIKAVWHSLTPYLRIMMCK